MKEQEHGHPIDRGWAWLVMLGAFFNTFFHFMFLRSLSIFFIEFLDRFQQSATVTTLAYGLNTAAFILGAILLPPVLLSRFTVRFVTLLGSFINAAAIIGLAFSPNMICLTCMFIFIGFAHPLIFVSQVALLGDYFKKRLSFAVAFSNIGLSGGLMIGPYLTRILLDEYGLTGSLLIHGAINFNLIAGSMLFRPPSFYKRRGPATEDNTDSPEIIILEKSSSTESLESKVTENDADKEPSYFENDHYNVKKDMDDVSRDGDLRKSLLIQEANSNAVNQEKLMLCLPKIKSLQRNGSEGRTVSVSNQSLNKDYGKPFKTSQDSFTTNDSKTRHRTASEMCVQSNSNGKINHHSGSEMCIKSKYHSKLSVSTNCSKSNSISKRSKSILDLMSSSRSVQYLSNSTIFLDKLFDSLSELTHGTVKHESKIVADIQSSRMITVEILDNDAASAKTEFSELCTNRTCCCTSCCSCGKGNPVSLSVEDSTMSKSTKENSACFNPLKLMLFLLAGIGVNTQCGAAYMPSLGKEQGLTTYQLPILMTVIGAADLCKLGIGYFADKGYIRRIHIVFVCQIIIGISFQFTSYFKGFEAMVALCIIFGFNTGVLHILLPGITVDVLGPAYIGQVMSGYFLINGAVMTVSHILIGSLKDTAGSFSYGYNFLGCLVLFGAVLVLMEPLFKRCARSQRT